MPRSCENLVKRESLLKELCVAPGIIFPNENEKKILYFYPYI